MKTRVARLVLLFAVLVVPRLSAAAPISYYFAGTFSDVFGTGAFLTGAAFSGRLDYDPDWQVTGVFLNGTTASVPAGAFELDVPGGSVTQAESWASLLTGAGQENLTISTLVNPGPFLGSLSNFDRLGISFHDESGTAIADPLHFPATLPALSAWSSAVLTLSDRREVDQQISVDGFAVGDVSCWSTDAAECAPPVPEPATCSLVALGLTVVAHHRRRVRR